MKKPLFFAFVDLEKACDRVPRKVLWWALRSSGVEEWAIRIIQGMYANGRSRVREFEVGVGVHQGSVLSPLLLDLPIRWSYKLTDVCSFVRLCVRYELFSGLAHLIFLIFCTMMKNGNSQNVTDLDF